MARGVSGSDRDKRGWSVDTMPGFEGSLIDADNWTAWQVGGFGCHTRYNKKTQTMTVFVDNDIDLYSLFWHKVPKSWNFERLGSGYGPPLGTIHQTFFWDIPVPAEYQEK